MDIYKATFQDGYKRGLGDLLNGIHEMVSAGQEGNYPGVAEGCDKIADDLIKKLEEK